MKKTTLFLAALALLLVVSRTTLAASTGQTTLYQTITPGTLDLTVSENQTFTPVSFSFEGQLSEGNNLGDINLVDTRGNRAGWQVNISGSNWTSDSSTMSYAGDGVSTGQLSFQFPGADGMISNAGDGIDGFTLGPDASFDADTPILNLVTVSSNNGSGDYTLRGVTASQFIPGNQQAGEYSMILTYTIS